MAVETDAIMGTSLSRFGYCVSPYLFTDTDIEDAAASEAYLTYFRLDAQNTPADVLEAMKLTLAKVRRKSIQP